MWFRAVLVRHCEMVSDTLLAAAILGRCPTALWPCMQKNYCQAHLRYPSSEKEHEDAANEEEAEAEEEEEDDEEEEEDEEEAEEEAMQTTFFKALRFLHTSWPCTQKNISAMT